MVKLPYFFIFCLLLIIIWLLSHHPSCSPYMSTIRGTEFSHIPPVRWILWFINTLWCSRIDLIFWCFLSQESSGLSSLLKEAASEDNTVIITMVDREWAKPASLLDLFLESFRIGERTKHLLNHLIVVALDNQALRYCRRAHPRCYLHTGSGKKIGSVNPDGLIAGWNKKALVKEILELGYNMIFTVSSLNAKFF